MYKNKCNLSLFGTEIDQINVKDAMQLVYMSLFAKQSWPSRVGQAELAKQSWPSRVGQAELAKPKLYYCCLKRIHAAFYLFQKTAFTHS